MSASEALPPPLFQWIRSPALTNRFNDLDTSISVLNSSFITWNRLQQNGIVKWKRYHEVVTETDASRYPNQFKLLHKGSADKQSILVGKGRYANVYARGQHAYKIVKISKERDEKSISHLRCNLKELCFFHSLRHPYIMQALQSQCIMTHGLFYKIIHEMPNGSNTLENMILSHELTWSTYKTLLYQIASALHIMHCRQVIHGDVKPSNVIIVHGRALLTDFTLTTMANRGVGMSFGSLFWRSPETLRLEECTQSSDVWSFAIMMLDCLYGCIFARDVLKAEDNEDLLQKLTAVIGFPTEQWQPFDDDQDDIDPPMHAFDVQDDQKMLIEDLVSRLLTWDPEQRLSAEEILRHPLFSGCEATPSASIEQVSANIENWTEKDHDGKARLAIARHS